MNTVNMNILHVYGCVDLMKLVKFAELPMLFEDMVVFFKARGCGGAAGADSVSLCRPGHLLLPGQAPPAPRRPYKGGSRSAAYIAISKMKPPKRGSIMVCPRGIDMIHFYIHFLFEFACQHRVT